jgi:hypothetical protein
MIMPTDLPASCGCIDQLSLPNIAPRHSSGLTPHPHLPLSAGDSGGAVQTAAALLGGSFAAGSHVAKAGSRAFINTSPEPVSNVAASFSEEAMLAADFGWPSSIR